MSVALLSLCPANAQTAEQSRRTVYEASFFSTFSPANALQMVQRVPGFTLDEGDTEVRGFSQAAGNVVINGQRPSSKSEALETVLARIPASRVLRIEVASGEQFGSDYAGKPQVANIVMTQGGGIAGTIEATARREYTGAILPEGSVSMLFRRGPSTFNFAVGVENNETTETGYDRVTERPSGAERELRLKTNRIRSPEPSASASWALEEGTNRNAHLNASLNLGYFDLLQTNQVFPVGGVQRLDHLNQDYFGRTVEVGGDVTRPFAGGGIKLVGLLTRRFRDRADAYSFGTPAGAAIGATRQTLRDWREESVLRLSWTKSDIAGWSAEMGVEGALNKLKSIVELTEVDAAGVAAKVDLPIDDALVTEYRGETFINVGRDLTSRLHVDLGLTYEASRLTVTGDVQARRSLTFLKPKATLAWRPGVWRTQIGIQRTVAQLNFEDFISVADIAADRVNGGNADLLPQRAWEILGSVDRPILGDGRAKLEIGYNRIEKVQDRVPVAGGFDAPGNLGSGTKVSIVGNLDLPLSRVAIKGGRLSLYGSWVKTRVRDPYTQLQRPFSGFSLFYYEVNFRQDLGKFAWGFGAEGSSSSSGFRRDEVDIFQGFNPLVSAFAEYRPSVQWTLTMGAKNLFDRSAGRDRSFFTPDRTSRVPYLHEERFRQTHIIGYFTIKRSFG